MGCCAPNRDDSIEREVKAASSAERSGGDAVAVGATVARLVAVPGGTFEMGDDSPWSYPDDGEGPARLVRVSPLAVAATAVTNGEFGQFVDATGHVTDAERFGWSFVFSGFLPDDFDDTRGVLGAEWWRQVFGASWRAPEGPQSSTDERDDHPVVHVSWNDATAYAAWAHRRLPTEAEWEYAARAGSSTTFPWGDELEPGGMHRANVFQGVFPGGGVAADGWAGSCPVDAFEPNAFGLSNMIGNVWEWTADHWASPRFDEVGDLAAVAPIDDPTGPAVGDGITVKGGSYLCHESYCRRYRPAARMRSTPDSSAGNIGFRCAADLDASSETGP